MSIRRRWSRRKPALETAQLNLEYCYIHSPIDGRAGARLVDVGNVVQANTTSLAVDSATRSHLRQSSRSPRAICRKCRRQMSGGALKAVVRLALRSRERQAEVGRVEFLDNAVQNGSGTVNLRATLSNADHHFWPGSVRGCETRLGHGKSSGTDSESGSADQPERALRLRGETG